MVDLVSSTSGDSAVPVDVIEVGCVVDAWGVKGWIKVHPFSKDPQALFSTTRWFLRRSEFVEAKAVLRHDATSGHHRALKVIDAKRHGEHVVAQVSDVLDRSGAEALIGSTVLVSRSSFPTPAVDEYYWVDLIGMAVVNLQGDSLGDVAGLIDAGPHSILRVRSAEAVERLIPFVGAYVEDVCHASRLIRVDWGLDF